VSFQLSIINYQLSVISYFFLVPTLQRWNPYVTLRVTPFLVPTLQRWNPYVIFRVTFQMTKSITHLGLLYYHDFEKGKLGGILSLNLLKTLKIPRLANIAPT